MSGLEVGTVVDYKPADRFDPRWCREGMAVVEQREDGSVFAADTYWGSGMDRHILTAGEIETATLRFRLDEFRPLERYEPWADFAPEERQVITSQHGLQRRYFVRLGAQRDLPTRIENARENVRELTAEVESAKSRLSWAQKALSDLVETAAAEATA